jgi:dTDP-4-dehydrorhamnose 3,5-epimerase-like enzyme
MIHGYKVVEVPSVIDERGSLSFIELGQLVNFVFKRAYWLYNIKTERGFHCHKELKQFIFCIHGSVDCILDDAKSRITVKLDSPNKGLILDQPLWREMKNFSNNTCVIVLASDIYHEKDYIRSYEEFKKWKASC